MEEMKEAAKEGFHVRIGSKIKSQEPKSPSETFKTLEEIIASDNSIKL